MSYLIKLACLVIVVVSCSRIRAEEKAIKALDESIHSIELTYPDVKMPAAPNQDVFLANCVSCHTLRYVTTQPALSEKTWMAEVTKMVKVFGAPIPDDKAQLIVKYLVATEGGKK